ncbi:hypothetical protein Tsubulata_000019, partial [Turnera subulata]
PKRPTISSSSSHITLNDVEAATPKMRQFKNRYMIFELFLDPNRDLKKVEPVKITPSNVTNAIRNSISENFGECGLGGAACKAAALKYDEMKFAQYKLLDGSSLSDADSREMHNNLEKIKCLEF